MSMQRMGTRYRWACMNVLYRAHYDMEVNQLLVEREVRDIHHDRVIGFVVNVGCLNNNLD